MTLGRTSIRDIDALTSPTLACVSAHRPAALHAEDLTREQIVRLGNVSPADIHIIPESRLCLIKCFAIYDLWATAFNDHHLAFIFIQMRVARAIDTF